MVFSSLSFLFLFLPVVLAVYYWVTRKYKNGVLLLFSYLFYFWGSGEFLAVLILSTVVDYFLALRIDRLLSGDEPRGVLEKPLTWVVVSLVFNLSLLGYYKYANFFVDQANQTLSLLGFSTVSWTQIVLPIGISFFTFHKISYIVDIYRHRRPAMTHFADFALYVNFFPQLIAGPIIRFYEISDQIKSRRETLDDFYYGILRFSWGLSKKILLANPCGEIADAIFSLSGGALDTKTAWLGVIAYTLQIYLDFSAYSDMAIGLARMFGFRFPENFNRPYSSVSITDFWRRWHMSLSRFFRDYLYIPIGGNRLSPARTYLNLVAVFILCGFWHGANWTFVIWGGYHGTLLILERASGYRAIDDTVSPVLRRVLTLFLVMIGWVFFRSQDLSQAMNFLKVMFSAVNYPLVEWSPVVLVLNGRNLFFFFLALIVFFLPRDFSAVKIWVGGGTLPVHSLKVAALAGLFLYSVAMLASGSFNPFIYFQF